MLGGILLILVKVLFYIALILFGVFISTIGFYLLLEDVYDKETAKDIFGDLAEYRSHFKEV